MRYSKRYIYLTLIIASALLLKLNTWQDEYGQVEEFRGASLQEEVFYPLIAKSLNDENLMHLVVDGKTWDNINSYLYLNQAMQPYASLELVQELFGASCHYADGSITLLRNDTTYTFEVSKTTYTKGDSKREMESAPIESDSRYYLPLIDLGQLFGFDILWDEENYTVTVNRNSKGTLPTSYDMRQFNRASAIQDQGNESTCWAYAAMGALESSILPEETISFDTGHLIDNNTYGRNGADGGDYMIAVSYLLSWRGPISLDTGEETKHLQNVKFFTEDDIDEIKWAIYKYGGVSTSIYADVSSNMSSSSYYNKSNNSYYYGGNANPNHDVVIIGWDDSMSADKFNNSVPGKGAFLCQNSWGDDFGDKGCFYVSYYDSNIGSQGVCYTGLESAQNYDNIYQTDLCGQIGTIGYSRPDIFAANVYTASGDETLRAVGFYTVGKSTDYTVYVVTDYKNTASLTNRVQVANGAIEGAGYTTIPFETTLSVDAGDDFAVIVKINTAGSEHPLAVEYLLENRSDSITIEDGCGFVSRNGMDWESSEENYEANICLKAYTDTKDE